MPPNRVPAPVRAQPPTRASPQERSTVSPRLLQEHRRSVTSARAGRVSKSRPRVRQNRAQQGAVAARLVRAVAADAEVGLPGQRRQQRDQPPRPGRGHLAPIAAGGGGPAGRGPPPRARPPPQRRAPRGLRGPHLAKIKAGVILFFGTPRRAAGRGPPPALPPRA